MTTEHFSIKELIERKRHGAELTDGELEWVIHQYTADVIPDYQMSALVMAIFLQGFTDRELAAWTEAMLHSGEVLDLSSIDAPKADKHSTGGVGDKVSIPLAPMVACCGIVVPMMSGRGLGHTGGTLDKLESISGFRTDLDPLEFMAIVERLGMVMAGQSETLVPADRRIYALRDATGTVPSIPLIASSIMSKKLAEDIDGLVLDVKVGTGAFMKDLDTARKLAETMVGIGKAHGTEVVALLTDMDQPLGREVGNASEIRESIEVLRGQGPPDLIEITYRLGEEMLLLAGVTGDRTGARAMLERVVASGEALERFRAVIEAQGGDGGVVEDTSRLPDAAHRWEVTAPRSGVVVRCDALDIGVASVRLGGGRERKEDTVDHGVGITLLAKRGDAVDEGAPLARVSYNEAARLEAARPLLERAWEIADEASAVGPLVIDEIRSA